jgi:pyridoxal phosphate enzyme (YggS family)
MIKDNLFCIRQRIATICSRINRQAEGIELVAATKDRTREQIQEALVCGISNIGENRVQEARLKCSDKHLAFSGMPIKWHMLGHLQTNKAKEAVKIFDLIQSVDSLHLAEEINRQAAKINKIQDVLIEVKTSPEATKFGIAPKELPSLLKGISAFKNIKIKGLMTIAPVVGNQEEARPYFRILRELRNNLVGSYPLLSALSMGMSDDFEVAIEEGATIVRLGRAIFD